MAYEPFTWVDGETAITAARLNAVEQGIADVELTPGPEGPQGPAGDTGPQGPAGADGADGADGFPSESQWNDLVARVDALESGA